MLQHARICRHPNEELELGIRGPTPEENNQDGENHGAHGIDPPFEFGTTNAGEHTEAIDEEIVAVVLPQDTDLTVLVAQRPAVQEKTEFRSKGNGDGDDRGEVKIVGFRS